MKGILRLSGSPIFLTAALASVLVPSFVVPALAVAHRWERLTTDNQENIYYIDGNIGKSGVYRTYWQRQRYHIPVHLMGQGNAQTVDTYYSIECTTKLRRQRHIEYTADGKVIDSNPYPDNQSSVVPPNTPDRIVADYVCKQ